MTAEPVEAFWRVPRLRVDRDGDWFDEEGEITHAGILENLRSGLCRDASGYYVQTRVRIPVEVVDVPYLVTRIERVDDRLHVHLNDGAEEDVDPATLRLGPGGAPYCAVRGGRLEARLTRAAAFQLLHLAAPDRDGEVAVLRLGGREYRLPAAGEPR